MITWLEVIRGSIGWADVALGDRVVAVINEKHATNEVQRNATWPSFLQLYVWQDDRDLSDSSKQTIVVIVWLLEWSIARSDCVPVVVFSSVRWYSELSIVIWLIELLNRWIQLCLILIQIGFIDSFQPVHSIHWSCSFDTGAMIHLLTLLGFIALSIKPSIAQCTPYVDPYNQYNVSLCTLNSANNVPPTIDTPNYWIPTSVDNSVSSLLRLNFSLNIYGVPHSSFM